MANVSLRPVTSPAQETYEKDWPKEFEDVLVYFCGNSPRFWASIGRHLEPTLLRDEVAQRIVKACHAISRATGEGPSLLSSVIQQLMAFKESGSITEAQVMEAASFLEKMDDAMGGRTMGMNDVIHQTAQVLKRRQTDEILARMAAQTARGESLSSFVGEIQDVEQIGTADAHGAAKLSSNVWDGIEKLRRASKLPTGVLPLDSAIGGGLHPRSLTVVGADMNVGKTAMLVHVSMYAWLTGHRVLLYSTEEGVNEVMARCVAWATGHSLDEVYLGGSAVQAKLKRAMARPQVGSLVIEYLPQGATAAQLRRAAEKALDSSPEMDGKFDLLTVDYADKMDGKGDSSYDRFKSVYEGLRQIAIDFDSRVLTASQLKDMDGKKGVPTAGDLADSRWKGRIADFVLTMWKEDESFGEERMYHWAKVRGRGAGTIVGPLATQLDRGRMSDLPAKDLLLDETSNG